MLDRRRFLVGGAALRGAALLPQTMRAAATAPPPAATEKARFERLVWRSYYSGTRVWGYVDNHSVTPGESFNLMLATGPGIKAVRGRIEVFRIGHHAGRNPADRRLVWHGEGVEAEYQEALYTAPAVGPGWPAAVDHIDTTGWTSGYYTIDFIDGSDGQRDLNVAFIIVTNPEKSGDILVGLSTNTYQAYNAWGGASLYESDFTGDSAQAVSFDRPTPPDFFEYEYYLTTWLERFAAEHGLKIDYATNFDIHRDPQFVEKCRLFISGCHNEYWSKEEFDAVHRRIFGLGKNTLFIGANTAYWQVRYADPDRPAGSPDRGRQLVCYKSPDDPIGLRVGAHGARLLMTAMFREAARRPETMLAGVAYQSYFEPGGPARYPYVVARTDLPFFAGTGYRVGEATGDIVGYEWDNRDPEGDGKRLWNQTSQIEPIDPASLQVVFTGAPVDLNGKAGRAEAVYFVSKAGAKVFSTGSIRWAWGLAKPGFEQEKFKRFNANLLLHLLDHAPASEHS